MKCFKLLAAMTATFVVLGSVAEAQVTDTERFRVNVPSNMTITAPVPLVTITHDETDNDQPFAAQQWQVKANAIQGATVSFSTDQAFTHTVDATFKRDARLDLGIASSDGPAQWTVPIASDQTDYSAGVPDEIATVQAVSNRPGRATFDLTVTFITDTYTTLAEGDYELTVTGTLTAN